MERKDVAAAVTIERMAGKEIERDVDRGYAWVILTGCYVMYLLVIGSYKTYGILYTEIDEYYSVGSGPVAIVGSLLLCIMFASGPFANYLAVTIGFRLTTFAGGLFLGIGYGASFLVTRLEFLSLTLGVLAGLGYGLTFAPCSTIISFYFEKRRALANGITVSASGIGAIGFSFLYKYLIETYALKPALLIIGGIVFNVCVAASCFRQPESLIRQKKKELKAKERHDILTHTEPLLNGDTSIENRREGKVKESKKCSWGPDFNFSLFKNPRFTLYAFAFMICMNGYSNNLILIPSQIKTLGFGKASMSTAVAITGASEIGARILTGWIADKKWITPKHIFEICFLISSVFAFITPFIDNLYYMYVYAAIVGIFPASLWSLLSVLIIEVVGMKDFPAALGLVLPFFAIGLPVSTTTIAWIKDKTGDWSVSFYVTAAMLLLPAIMMLIEPLIIPEKYMNLNTREKISNSTEEKIPTFENNLHTNQREKVASLYDDIGINIEPHRSSKIYKAYSNGYHKKQEMNRISAPLATPDNV